MTSNIKESDLATPAIALRGVGKRYGAHRVVDHVDFVVGQGELVGLIGHNGAGKSTLFKMMLGLVPPSEGELVVAGASVGGRGFRAARRRIGYLPENLVLYDNLSGRETLHFFARLKGVSPDACEAMLARVGLADAARRPVREYSKGMRQRLGFAQALLGQPRVLFLDEPTNGLDPAAIRDFYEILLGLRTAGVTIVLTSHILAELQQRADRFAVMAAGRMQAVGSVAALRAQLGLPVTLALRLEPGARPAAIRRLQAEPGLALEIREGATGQDLTVRCVPQAKMAVLAALQPLGRWLDLHIHEPSLEDLFLGLGRPA
ncbi:putative ABC transporter ATP-binding protein NosF [Cupriavidus yeoncheonensis]|uniref:ABC transporter ATP-binding protein NosF n=1 Tax=Cupriavidus yeoncheonensis TaxID=1462994 RepID=A0A916IT06_9BURK|nr:ABC transporter ATP-binding protein [Cupriavidus yeoncheonensis]CAG2143420.1 putative ABC transporter ATP-binding protein NosF [Cupriavidus yeoncheonensis]